MKLLIAGSRSIKEYDLDNVFSGRAILPEKFKNL